MSRSREFMPITKDSTKLLIGLMQVRIGLACPRASVEAYRSAAIAQQKVNPVSCVASGTYTGTKAGSYIVEIEAGGSTFKWTDPEGNATTGVSLSATAVLLEDGISVTFSAATGATAGNKWVIGVQPTGIVTAIQTGIISPYSILDKTRSVGAVQSAQITGDITVKEHSSGYPAQKDLVIVEASNITVEVTMEEFGNDVNAPLIEAMLDAINTGQVYAFAVEGVAQFANGDVKSFWIPNTNLVPNFQVNPGNDWAGIPFKFDAVAQTGITPVPRLIYMNSFAG